MTDPMQLLRAANPVRDCDAPDFDRLLARLEHEPDDSRVERTPAAPRGRISVPRTEKVPRGGGGGMPHGAGGGMRHVAIGRRFVAAFVPVAVAVAVAAVAVVSLHGTPTTHRGGPAGPLASGPGQAHGHVAPGSMHRFTVAASGARGQTWGAEWFRTTAGQVCVQAGREVGSRLGYVDVDGILPHDGRFHPWAPDTAVDARCVDQPAHGGVALTVVDRVADSGYELPASGACTAAEHTRCPASDTTTLYFGVLGSAAAMVNYGPERHSVQPLPAGPGADGEYLEAFPTAWNACSISRAGCHARFPLPSHRAFVDYSGARGTCVLRGPGTDGVLSGDCPYGLTIGPSSDRLTVAQVRAPVTVATRRTGRTVAVAARFRARVSSSQIGEYELRLSTPTRCPPPGGVAIASLPLGSASRAGAPLTLHGTVKLTCAGTYHGAILVQPLVGSRLTVARFSFKERRGS